MVGSFVGRVSELAALTSLTGRLHQSRRPIAALVVGDPGSGKTRLLGEVRNQLGATTVLTLSGYEAGRELPLGGATELLHALIETEREGPQLNAMLYQESVSGSGPELLRICESAHRCLSEFDGVFVIVDDLHWLDDSTAALCHYLMRAAVFSGRALGVIVASRPSPQAAAFADSMKQVFAGSDDFAEVVLEPLTRAEGMKIAQELAPQLSDDDAAALWGEAEGSPFWLGVLARSDRRYTEHVISSRLRGISTDAATLMTLLVVAARPVSIEEAWSELAWAPDRVDYAGQELVGRGVVLRSVNTLAVSHDLVRAAVERDVPPATARDMHIQMARHLESVAQGELSLLAEALAHRRAAGMDAVDLALSLAGSPRRRLLGLDALGQLEAIADEAVSSHRNAAALNVAVAALAAELQNHDAALGRYALACGLFEEPEARAQAGLGAARAAFELRRYTEAREWLARARAWAPENEVLRVELDVQEALVLRWLGHEPDRARRLSRAALVAARALTSGGPDGKPDPSVRGAYLFALRAEFDAAFQATDVRASLELSDEMSTVARGRGEQQLKASISSSLLLIEAGRVREAEPRLQAARRWAQQEVFPLAQVESAFLAALSLRHLARFDEAMELAREASALAVRVGTPTRMSFSWTRAVRHLIELSQGGWQRALSELKAELASEEDPHYRLFLRYNLAVSTARLARPSEASAVVWEQFEGGSKDARVAGCDRCRGEFMVRLAESLVRIGAVDAATDVLVGWDQDHPVAHRQQRFLRSWVGALIDRKPTGSVDAVASLERLIVEADEMGFVLESLWVELDRGRALTAIEPKKAVSVLETVADRAAGLGARNEERVALRSLRALGVRTWRRALRDPASLTPRELEVAQLVADGASNPEIAEALFLARKTVERHVSNILAKTGVRNRTELAARLGRRAPEPAPRRMGELPDESAPADP
ncbi:MAG: LuxR C-terminal-related transcriptional regulator [Actinomycetota bacterium]|nr:LuxR C-terminal-related transcriptional regulator [Actinomycetota bacterium]